MYGKSDLSLQRMLKSFYIHIMYLYLICAVIYLSYYLLKFIIVTLVFT